MFVVDEREFDSPEQAQATADDALMEINRRRIAGEVETRPVRPGEPPSGLPRWPEYKRRLDASDTAEQP
nr:hypothetical protein OG546_49890 [Streptomyces antimycoticus]